MARVVLTQPAPRVEALAARLRGLGHDALVLGLSRIVERTNDPALSDAVDRLAQYDWVILVSPGAAHAAARLVPDWPARTGVAVVGPGSRAALSEAGFRQAPSRVLSPDSPPFDGEALAALRPLDAPMGLRVLVLRGESGSDTWIEGLRTRGARVDVVAGYRHETLEPSAEALATLRAWLDDANDAAPPVRFVVTQTATVERLDTVLVAAGLHERAKHTTVLTIHARIASALRKAGWRDVRQVEPGEQALMLALESASDSTNRHGV